MGTPRRSDQRTPRLAMPEVVVLRAAPVMPTDLRAWGTPDLVWIVTAYRHPADGGGALVRCLTDQPAGWYLRVLVRVPLGAADIRACVSVRGQHLQMPSSWGPCIIVPPDRHDPDRGWYSLSDWPLITFEETTREPIT